MNTIETRNSLGRYTLSNPTRRHLLWNFSVMIVLLAFIAGTCSQAVADSPLDSDRKEQVRDTDELKIDPLLVAQANLVWDIVATDKNPIWPGWDASSTPILFYLPGQQDVLMNHPNPPEGFVPYTGPVKFSGGNILLKNGKTLIEWDGQNTSRDVNGVESLVVADTLSNRKQWLGGLLGDPRSVQEKMESVEYTQMAADPYSQMAMITHEAFHVYQFRRAPNKGANELHVRQYPCLSWKNNVGFALEGIALAECLRATDEDSVRKAAIEWLAARKDRRASLSPAAVAYEDGNEFTEGLAKYTEWKLAQVLEGRTAPEVLWMAQGFRGFKDLTPMREQQLDQLLLNMQGKINVNNDPFGTAPVRFRLYFSGMAISALLDRLEFDWKERILKPGVTLTELAAEAIGASEAELDAALQNLKSDSAYEELVATKKQLHADGLEDTNSMLKSITEGQNTCLEIDASALGDFRSSISFTPFGVRAVDDHRTIYTMVPVQAFLGSRDYQFRQSTPTVTYEDRENKKFRFQLNSKIDADVLAKALDSQSKDGDWIQDLDIELGGVKLLATRARFEFRDNRLVVQFAPVK